MDRNLSQRQAYLARKNDEELVALAKRHEVWKPAATQALWLRHYERFEQVINQRAHDLRLKAEDVEDAKQELFFSIRRAMDRFEPNYRGKRRCFRTFLGWVVMSGLNDMIRCVQRRQHHQERGSAPADGVPAGVGPASDGSEYKEPCPSADPLLHAEWQELQERLGEAVAELGESDRLLCNDVRSGMTTRDIAGQLGFSLAQVRRLYGALVARLRIRLNGERR